MCVQWNPRLFHRAEVLGLASPTARQKYVPPATFRCFIFQPKRNSDSTFAAV